MEAPLVTSGIVNAVVESRDVDLAAAAAVVVAAAAVVVAVAAEEMVASLADVVL